jgi:hypothetical protein
VTSFRRSISSIWQRNKSSRVDPKDIAQVELKKMQVELDQCLGSMNPLNWLKAIRLEKRVNLAIKVRKEEAAAERKLIHVSFIDSDNVVDDADSSINLSRELFNDWVRNEKLLHQVDITSNTNKFEDVVEGGSYYLRKRSLSTNYDGYAKAEADRQAQDCAEAIRDGHILIPPFNEKGTRIFYEYDVNFPKGLSDIRPPIRPGAILIHGSDWLVLEVKHNFSNSLLQRFAKVCDFIEKYRSEKWVCKQHPVPTKVVKVACSKVGYSKVNSGTSGIIKLLNKNQTYKIVDDM